MRTWPKEKNYLRVVLVQVFKFKTGTSYGPEILQLCGKIIKSKGQKCWGKLAGKPFALPPPTILNRVENESADSRPVKTIKKRKDRFHYFIACSEEVTCIVTIIILENMFWNIKSADFTYGGTGNSDVELACLQILNITLRKIFIYLFYLRLEQF